MTSSINDSVIEYLLGTNYDAISTTAGLAAVFALTLLLLQREMVRAHGGERAARWIGGLDVAVLPLVVSFGMIVLLRLLQLLPR